MKAEVKRLQMAMLRTSAKECDVCKQRLVNKRHQMCQTVPNNVVRFCGTSSGIIDVSICQYLGTGATSVCDLKIKGKKHCKNNFVAQVPRYHYIINLYIMSYVMI